MSHVAPFEAHGVDLSHRAGEHVYGNCPFCDANKFYVNVNTGQWDCKRCLKTGNVYTFLEDWGKHCAKATTAQQWKWLEKSRGLPAAAFKPWGVGCDNGRWLIPVQSANSHVLDLRIYEPERSRVITTAGMKTGLNGLNWLAKADPGTEVWLCEGEWDGIALRWLLRLSGDVESVVVSVPGAGTFKNQWVQHFRDMRVRLCYDNDGPGERGSQKAANELNGVARELWTVRWPRERPSGYDIRDFVLAHRKKGLKASKIVRLLRKLLVEVDVAQLESGHAAPGTIQNVIHVGSIAKPPNFAQTLEEYKRWIKMTPLMEDGLRLAYAAAFAIDIPGDPLWLYMVGPPGSGKTLLLMSLAGSSRTIFRSTIGPHALISGFKAEKDPSEMPLWDGKCVVLKDFTEILSTHPLAKEEMFGYLRGAYDGHVVRGFGNGVKREYHLRFGLLAGVTPAIHGDLKASLGERFLKFDLLRDVGWSADDVIRAAIGNISRENDMELALAEAAGQFLSRSVDLDGLPQVPEWFSERIVALAQLISGLRAVVERESYGDQRLKYRPSHEIGTRLAKQLVKLAMGLGHVDQVKVLGPEQYRLIERVAFDTAIGFHLEIVASLMDLGGEATKQDLATKTGLPFTNLGRALDDLQALGIVSPRKSTKTLLGPGRDPVAWTVVDKLKKLWVRSEIGEAEAHIKRIVRVRRRRSWPVRAKVRKR